MKRNLKIFNVSSKNKEELDMAEDYYLIIREILEKRLSFAEEQYKKSKDKGCEIYWVKEIIKIDRINEIIFSI